MVYFLKKSTPSKKGVYLQIYQSFYVPGKGGRNKSYRVLGYIDDLIKQGITEPLLYAQAIVDELNRVSGSKKEPLIGMLLSPKTSATFC